MMKKKKGRPPSEPARVFRAVKVPADLDCRLVNTVFWCNLESFSEVILNGIDTEISRLEGKYNGGEPFPPAEDPKR